MAAAKRDALVPRPTKKAEYEIRFGTVQAGKGWSDLVATIRNAMADTWDFLTITPQLETPTNYRLRGSDLGKVSRGTSTYDRWQHKPTVKGTARIWFYVDKKTVVVEQVHTSHPNETKN